MQWKKNWINPSDWEKNIENRLFFFTKSNFSDLKKSTLIQKMKNDLAVGRTGAVQS